MVDQRNGKFEVVIFCAALSRNVLTMLLPASNAKEASSIPKLAGIRVACA